MFSPHLDVDSTGIVLKFLTPHELALVSTLNSSLREEDGGEMGRLLTRAWLEQNERFFGFALNLTTSSTVSCHQLSQQFALNRPLAHNLVSLSAVDGDNLLVKGNSCAFIGTVGEAFRSVQSVVPFPCCCTPYSHLRDEDDDDLTSWLLTENASEQEKMVAALINASVRLAKRRILSFINSRGGGGGGGGGNDFGLRLYVVAAVKRALLPLIEAVSTVMGEDVASRLLVSAVNSISVPVPVPVPHSMPPSTPVNFNFQFVSPFLDRNCRMVLSPRSIAYFEVAIGETNLSSTSRDLELLLAQQQHDCVAIGLAVGSGEFTTTQLLPGWNLGSYGYHSDDGAIFHGRGSQLKTYGPTFGPGDVVGCGLDYISRTIFFTLNGKNLGTAFTLSEIDLTTPLSPIVGLDSNANIIFNFGVEKPFEFDLSGALQQ